MQNTNYVNKGLTGGSPSSFCQIATLEGFESTSHFNDTAMPSLKG